MARGVNKVILVGTLGNDPETKYMPSGGAVVNISIATNENWTDKNSGQKQERTEWHRVVAFNRLAEVMGQYLRKGSQVYIEGKLRTNKWQDQNGQDRYTTEILANDMQMLGGRSGGTTGFNDPSQSQNTSTQQQGQYQPPQPAPPQGQAPPQQQPTYTTAPNQGYAPPQQSTQQPSAPAKNVDDFDDDIPF